MTISDIPRVLKGARLVLDQAAKIGGPIAVQRCERLYFHFSEVMKSVCELTKSANNIDPNTVNTSSVNDFNEKQQEVKEKDIIGFDSLDENDLKSSATTINNIENNQKIMKEQTIPSTQFGRLVGFGGLAMKLAIGEMIHKATSPEPTKGLSEASAEKLAESLCKMRGAALKLGQMLSIQDNSKLSPTLSKALDRVRQSADYMPFKQLNKQLKQELGENWNDIFESFDTIPIAAASIGQVHKAVLKDGSVVAVKIQYPGVSESIHSDLNNLKTLINLINFLPPGLFIDNIIKVAGRELVEECDYIKEAENQMRYKEFIEKDKLLSKYVYVPKVFQEYSTDRILITEFIEGNPIDQAVQYSQNVRNAIARTILVKSFKELFEFQFCQSDPNFANFLYDNNRKKINMIDFGACRTYPKQFVSNYLKLIWAASNNNVDEMMEISKKIGFLTGEESIEFLEAHKKSGLIIGEPFLTYEPYDFGQSEITTKVSTFGNVFLKYRLTPPPDEIYSLHRKLAGAFLLCIKLKAKIPCRDILEDIYYNYKFEE